MPLDEALDLIEARVDTVTESETVRLSDCLGRVLAQSVPAPCDVPPHANSAVDGYAIRFADLAPDHDTVLTVVGRAAAGHPEGRPVGPGDAVRIFTGAVMPEGADTV